MRRAAAGVAAMLAAVALAAEPDAPGKRKAQACATCHGNMGLATAPDTPSLAGQPRTYLVAQLKAFRSGKRPHEVMAVIAKPLSDADIEALAEWYASIEVEVRAAR